MQLIVATRPTPACTTPQIGGHFLGFGAATDGDEVSQSRIGDLLPDRADTWWRLYDGVDIDSVAQDVIASIERFGLPWLREQLAVQSCG